MHAWAAAACLSPVTVPHILLLNCLVPDNIQDASAADTRAQRSTASCRG